MDQIVLPRNGRRPLVITGGQLIARYSDSPDARRPDFSGMVGRYHTAEVYLLANSNRYALTYSAYSMWPGEGDYHNSYLCGSLEELFELLESESIYQRAANALIEELGGDIVVS